MGWSRVGTIAVLLAMGTSQAMAGAPIYSWQDEQGGVHFVDSPELIPKKYFKEAVSRAQAGAMMGDGQGGTYSVMPLDGAGTMGGSSDIVSTEIKDDGAAASGTGDNPGPAQVVKDKKYWQGQVRDLRGKMESADQGIAEVDNTIVRLRATGVPGYQQQIDALNTQRQLLEGQKAEAQKSLESLPKNARKEGARQEWLNVE